MLKNKNILFISILLLMFTSACKKPVSQPVIVIEKLPLLQIGNEEVSISNFEVSYKKYKSLSDTLAKVTPQEYLKVFTENKLKIINAKSTGIDTTSDFKEEVDTYKKHLAKNFLKDEDLIEQLSKEAYMRLKQEVNASHILISVSEYASPADTLIAYRAAIAMKGRLDEGSDFNELASQFSNDPTAKTNHGNLGNFTALQMIYPIENIAYSATLGKVNEPVRSKSGYHIVKVNNRKANRGLVQIAHIMLKLDNSDTETKKEITKAQIFEAQNKLNSGTSWNEVVQAYSEDFQSKPQNGLLPMFGIGQMVIEIENAAFNLAQINSISAPIKTIYGWHILKLVAKESIQPYENLEAYLKQKVVTDSRGQIVQELKANKLRKTYQPTEFLEPLNQTLKLVDSTLLTGNWDYLRAVNAEWNKIILFAIGDENFDAASFLDYVKRKQVIVGDGASPIVVFKKYYNDYLTNCLYKYQIAHLDEINPEFKALVGEIQLDMLVNQVMEDQVWQKSIADSVGQLAIYEKNKTRYQYPDRAFGTIISAPSGIILRKFQDLTSQKPYLLERKSQEVLFEENSSGLPENSKPVLNEIRGILRSNPNYLIEIAGYRSSEEKERLSTERIKNVVNFLIHNDIPLTRILEKDYGSFRSSSDPARNKRVSFQFYTQSLKDFEKIFNEDNTDKITINEGYFTKDQKIFADAIWKTGEQLINTKSIVKHINIERIEPARMKKFNEARGSVINDYQKELENTWLEKLKVKYPIKVNAQELEKVAL